jgi:hypothetical protein
VGLSGEEEQILELFKDSDRALIAAGSDEMQRI